MDGLKILIFCELYGMSKFNCKFSSPLNMLYLLEKRLIGQK